MANLKIRVYNVSLFREHGLLVDETQVDEKSDELALGLFYTDFDQKKMEGDYLEWEDSTEIVSEKDYESACLTNEILETIEE